MNWKISSRLEIVLKRNLVTLLVVRWMSMGVMPTSSAP